MCFDRKESEFALKLMTTRRWIRARRKSSIRRNGQVLWYLARFRPTEKNIFTILRFAHVKQRLS